MTYHDAEVLSAIFQAQGHSCDVRPAVHGWLIRLTCGCGWHEAKGGPCRG